MEGERAGQNVLATHTILDAAGIPSAAGEACDDLACYSHLTHRTHRLVEQRDAALARAERAEEVLALCQTAIRAIDPTKIAEGGS